MYFGTVRLAAGRNLLLTSSKYEHLLKLTDYSKAILLVAGAAYTAIRLDRCFRTMLKAFALPEEIIYLSLWILSTVPFSLMIVVIFTVKWPAAAHLTRALLEAINFVCIYLPFFCFYFFASPYPEIIIFTHLPHFRSPGWKKVASLYIYSSV